MYSLTNVGKIDKFLKIKKAKSVFLFSFSCLVVELCFTIHENTIRV